MKKIFLSIITAGVLLVSCSDDDDVTLPEGTVSISLSTTTTVNEEDGDVEITLNTNNPFLTDVEIAYELSGTATINEDYTIATSPVTLTADATTVNITLSIIDDETVELEETITIAITGITGDDMAEFVDEELTITLVDNDSYPYENGLLLLHEGNFGQGNARIDFLSNDLQTNQTSIFSEVNGRPLGDTGQSIAFSGDVAYIVLNNSQKIEVVNRFTFESITTIDSGLLNPRFMAIVGEKGYVTNWGDGTNPDDDYVAVVNLTTNSIESNIAVAEGPEAILANGETVYVAHKGGFGQNNIVSAINTTNSAVVEITVDDSPNSMQLTAEGELFVLCGGVPSWAGTESGGSLIVIETADNTVARTLEFAETEHPGSLEVDADGELYYMVAGNLFTLNVDATDLPTNPILTGKFWYGIDIIGTTLYGSDAKDYVSNGAVEVYDLIDISLISTLDVGVIPAAVYENVSSN
ncbi:DUF5074 domain-containing protein [Croceivirga radicis]|uniref:DUF5074 domain-containing protein n=1 Tax=Croceivirga radicis TaxID=1929488 RepID=UPI001595F170|nr:DUF5074 domain-containing protein [Croceivirga radicis]